MSKDEVLGTKLSLALQHINKIEKTPKKGILELIPVLEANATTLTGSSRVALQIVISKVKDMIRDAAAHSETIALFHIFALIGNKSPIRLVTSLDMCYQCEKACVSVLPSIPAPVGIGMPGGIVPYKILTGAYKQYSRDEMKPGNTRARLAGKCVELVKIALIPGSDVPPVPDVVLVSGESAKESELSEKKG
jgi:hypothetical protein